MNWVSGRSMCENCRSILGIRDLVPIISFLALRGRCRHCGAKIQKAWLVVEVAALAVAAISVLLLPVGWAWAAAMTGWVLIFVATFAWVKRGRT